MGVVDEMTGAEEMLPTIDVLCVDAAIDGVGKSAETVDVLVNIVTPVGPAERGVVGVAGPLDPPSDTPLVAAGAESPRIPSAPPCTVISSGAAKSYHSSANGGKHDHEQHRDPQAPRTAAPLQLHAVGRLGRPCTGTREEASAGTREEGIRRHARMVRPVEVGALAVAVCAVASVALTPGARRLGMGEIAPGGRIRGIHLQKGRQRVG